uniref:Glycosyl hydrolase family 81 N-terminal domain-containing protein n=1 Tax=Zea mays TaxID=4577 RepID=B4F8U2_MAIZE|nr:unknown [Zea mays]
MPHHGSHRPPAPPPGGPVFPRATSTVVPDPSRFFAPPLLAAPLPTNSFFQNFVLKNGDQPEYVHPYSVRSPGGAALDICYPSRNHSPSFVIQTFVPDLTVSDAAGSAQRHCVSAFDDLSVTLDVSPSLRAHLVRGCPYVTVTTTAGAVDISVASVHAFLDVASCDDSGTKWRLGMNSGQTFLLYASAPIRLAQTTTTQLSAPGFAGAIRVAYLPDASMEPVLDRYSRCFPTAGHAALSRPFCVDYAWRKDGPGELLMLAHPLHLRLLADDCPVRVLDDFRYRSIDGDMVGVVGDAWVLRTDPVSPTWHSTRGVSEDGVAEVVAALRADVGRPRVHRDNHHFVLLLREGDRAGGAAGADRGGGGVPRRDPGGAAVPQGRCDAVAGRQLPGERLLLRRQMGRAGDAAGAQGLRRRLRVRHLQRPPLPPGLLPVRHRGAVQDRPVLGPQVHAAGLLHGGRLHDAVAQQGRRQLHPPADVRPLEAALVGRGPDGVRRRAQPGEHQRGRERLLLGGACGAQLRGRAPRLRGRDAHRAGDAGGPDVVARPGRGGHLRGRLQREQPRGWGAVGQQARQRAVVRAARVEGVPAGDPAAARAAHQRGAVPGRGVRQGPGGVDAAGAGEGRRGRRVEGVRVRAGGDLRQGGSADQDPRPQGA